MSNVTIINNTNLNTTSTKEVDNIKTFSTLEREGYVETVEAPCWTLFGQGGYYYPATGAVEAPNGANQGIVKILTHKEFTLWKDTQDEVYSLIHKSSFLKCEGEKATEVTYLPHLDEIVRLRISSTGKITLTKKGKIVVDPREIKKWLAQMSWNFDEVASLRLDYVTYMLSRNPKLQGANFPSSLVEEYYANPTWGRKAYYYLSKGRVAEARSILLSGIPNAPKGLLKSLQESAGLRPYEARRLLSEGFDVQLMSSLVATYRPGSRQAGVLSHALKLIHKFPGLKKSVLDTLKKGTEEGLRLILDTLFMDHRAVQDDEFRTLREAHDVLMERDLEARKPVILPRMETLYELPVYKKGEYEVRSMNAHDLPDLGRALSICVGSYKEAVWMGEVAISAVYKGEKPVACLEWVEGHVVQAKLFANNRVKNNSEITEVVSEWMQANNLRASTGDLKGGAMHPEGVRMKALPERVEAKAKAPKGEIGQNGVWGFGNNFQAIPEAYQDDNPVFDNPFGDEPF